jgi:hypothetical protein
VLEWRSAFIRLSRACPTASPVALTMWEWRYRWTAGAMRDCVHIAGGAAPPAPTGQPRRVPLTAEDTHTPVVPIDGGASSSPSRPQGLAFGCDRGIYASASVVLLVSMTASALSWRPGFKSSRDRCVWRCHFDAAQSSQVILHASPVILGGWATLPDAEPCPHHRWSFGAPSTL